MQRRPLVPAYKQRRIERAQRARQAASAARRLHLERALWDQRRGISQQARVASLSWWERLLLPLRRWLAQQQAALHAVRYAEALKGSEACLLPGRFGR